MWCLCNLCALSEQCKYREQSKVLLDLWWQNNSTGQVKSADLNNTSVRNQSVREVSLTNTWAKLLGRSRGKFGKYAGCVVTGMRTGSCQSQEMGRFAYTTMRPLAPYHWHTTQTTSHLAIVFFTTALLVKTSLQKARYILWLGYCLFMREEFASESTTCFSFLLQ